MAHHHAKLVIVGSGPAGYTAAIYAARAMLEPILIAGTQPGGQLTITTDVENYPGFADAIQGPWLMEQMRLQAEHVGTRMISDLVVKAEFGREPFCLEGDSGDTYSADAVVIATGAQARWLGLPSESTFQGFGVSACATCDGFFFRGKDVAVVGGGNTAVEEALYLANLARSVTLVHRRSTLRAERILQDRLHRHPNIRVRWNAEVDEILGQQPSLDGPPPGVTGVRLRDVRSGGTEDLAVDGVFVAIGHKPATDVFGGQLHLKPGGYILTAPNSTATNIPGVFAAGDVADDVWRQAVTAAGTGCMAALEVERFLEARNVLHETGLHRQADLVQLADLPQQAALPRQAAE